MTKAAKKNPGPRRPLPEVEQFIRLVYSRLSKGAPTARDGIWFSLRDEGSLFLDAEETTAYGRLVAALMTKFVPAEDLSRRSVESFLQDALFSSLDLRGRSSVPFEDRLLAALTRLAGLLNAPTQKFRCWVPIEGLQLDKPRAHFGGVSFMKFGRHQLRQIALKRPRTAQARGKSWRSIVKLVRESELWGGVCAVADVQARDSTSADVLAARRVRQILDVLNLFSDLVPYNHGWLYLPGDAAKGRQVVAVQGNDGGFYPRFSALDPLADVSWKALKTTSHISLPLRRLSGIARAKPRRDACASLLLSAAQWAGRATVDRRREQSFLLYAIALETMMLPTKEAQGLGHRLRLRVAHLLGRTLAARKRIAEEVTEIYDVRSKVVHAGSYEVTDENLGRLRLMVKSCLFRLLMMPAVHSKNRKELSAWFDRKLLR